MFIQPRDFARRLRLAALFFLALAVPLSGARAAAQSDLPQLHFEKFTLPNGLEVILSENHRLPLVTVNLWYHVGPANEEPGRTGFAHLFEHLMFAGSKHVPRGSHIGILEASGVTDMNGTTSFDRTNYYETLPSNQLALALWLESDRMGYLLDTIDQAALSTQQDVVRNERRQTTENQPYGIVEDALFHQLYPKGHPYYAKVIGSHADIQAAKLDDVKQFFRRYYAPNNASLAIVGDFDAANARALVERYFGSLKRGAAVPRIHVETPKITAERRIVVKDRIELPRLYMAWLTPAVFKPGDAEADVAALILGGGRASRLYKKLVYEKQIAQDVSVGQQSLMLGSIFEIEVTARPGHTLEEIERAIDEELEAFRAKGPDAGEVERARNTYETQTIEALEGQGGSGGVADRLNFYNHYLGNPDYLQQDIERYRAVTPAAVTAFAREQLRPTARVVVLAEPGEPDLGAPVPTPAPGAVVASKGAESVNADEPWRSERPKPAAAHPLRLATPESVKLANGLTLILSARKDLPAVAAFLVLKSGGDTNPIDSPGLANFTAAMLREGTQTRSALQIADEVAQIGASLSSTSSKDESAVATYALKKNFAAAIDVMADVVLRPSFPAAEIERQRAARLGGLAQQRENAGAVAQKITATVLYGERNPYGHTELGTEASVKAMKRDQMVAFWKQNFVPNNAALIVAGDISMSEIRALAEKAFGSWQSGAPARPVFPPVSTPKPLVVIVNRPGAQQTELRVATLGAPRSSPDFDAMEVMNTALGGQFSSRINLNLREAHGYTYGANSGFGFHKFGGSFVVGTGVRTDVTAPAVTEVFRELRGIAAAPIPADELKRAKDAMSYSLAGGFQTNAGTAANFASLYVYDLGLDYYSHYADSVNAITAEQAQAAAKKYLVPSQMVVIAVGDRANIEGGLQKLNLGTLEILDAEGKPVR